MLKYIIKSMKQKYRLNPCMKEGGEMVLSICQYVSSSMALTHIVSEKYIIREA